MSLERRLARAAKSNARDVGSRPAPPSGEARVEGRDKATGQFMVRRNGHVEMAETATTGILKLGVEAPVIQGKIFAVPHQPKVKITSSFPHIATAGNHNVFVAYLPLTIERDPLLPSFTSGYRLSTRSFYNRVGKRPTATKRLEFDIESSVWANSYDDFIGEDFGNKILTLGSRYPVSTMDRSAGYKIFAEVIDFVFPAEGQSEKMSSRVLAKLVLDDHIYNEAANLYLERGTHIALRRQFCLFFNQEFVIPSSLPEVILYFGKNNGRASLRKLLNACFLDGKRRLIVTDSRFYVPAQIAFNDGSHSDWTIDLEAGFAPRVTATSWLESKMLGVVRHGRGLAFTNNDDTLLDNSLGLIRGEGYLDTNTPSGGEFRIRPKANSSKDLLSLGGGVGANYGFIGASEYSKLAWFASSYWYPKFTKSEKVSSQNMILGSNANHGFYWNPEWLIPLREKKQKEFSKLLVSLLETVGESLYANQTYFFSGLYPKDPLQCLYGGANSASYWIKGLSEESVDSVNTAEEIERLEQVRRFYLTPEDRKYYIDNW